MKKPFVSGIEFVSFAAFPDLDFIATNPFFFALVNNKTKSIMFSGRIVKF